MSLHKYEFLRDCVAWVCICIVLTTSLLVMKSCVPNRDKLTVFKDVMETRQDLSKQELERMFGCFKEDKGEGEND